MTGMFKLIDGIEVELTEEEAWFVLMERQQAQDEKAAAEAGSA